MTIGAHEREHRPSSAGVAEPQDDEEQDGGDEEPERVGDVGAHRDRQCQDA